MKGYIVLEKGFEYDDNIYHELDGGGGQPKKIFFTKLAGQEEINRLNIERFKNLNISHYTYSIEDICDPDRVSQFVSMLNEKYGKVESKNKWDSADSYRLHKSANEEESLEYLSMVGLRFFELVEVDIDTQDMRDNKINTIIE